jgi:DNA replicative helicase MCM subunit Mcm2 (Cdc46/Mcm family)
MGFRCAACGHDMAVEATRAPDAILRCSGCEKIFGRTDAVVTEMVDKATEVSTQMLRLALHKLFNAA